MIQLRITCILFGARRLNLLCLSSHIKLVCCRVFGRGNWRFIGIGFTSRSIICFVHMDSLRSDKAFKFFVVSNCFILIQIYGILIATTRNIVMSPCLESLLHILNSIKYLSRSLHLLRTNLQGALKVLLTSLTLPKFLMRVHVVEEHFVISTSLLAICPTLVKVVK